MRELVQDAVAKRLVADVPVGCLLSGGVDSSVVALCMTRAVGDAKRVRTFSIGFDDDPRYDESRHAAEVARHLGTTHREFRVSAKSVDVPALLAKLASVFGEPFADSSAIPTSILARHVRQEVTVALGGDGGDELFGGYDRYRALALSAKLRRMRGVGLLARATRLLPAGHAKSRLTRAKRFGEALGLGDDARYASYTRLFSPADLARLAPSLPAVPPYPLDAHTFGGDPVAAAAALDRRTYLPDDLLVKLDRCAMLHALEVRAPFMDRRLLRLADSLRGEELVENGRGKALLRRAFAPDLPAAVFERRKMGFAVPPAVLTSPAMFGVARELLASSASQIGLPLESNALRQFVAKAEQSPATHAQRLYALVMVGLWAREAFAEAPNCA